MINSKQIRYRPKILLVDDQEINRDILGVILEDDYDLIYAENGEEALKLMNSSYESLSLVMLDLMMPVMDGFKVLEIVEQDERLKKIPIIVLTAEKSAELKALQMGAADFITKPFNVHEIILARVSRIIELSEGRKLITAAERDHLSGLYTRSFFYEYAERIYDHHPERKMDAVMIDVEQFHSVNAMHGRKFADLVLQTIGNEIRSFLQENSGIASRHEADRFYIYCLPLKDYRVLLERLQKKVDGLSPGVSIHLRMGVAPYSAGIEPVALSDRARTACNMVRGNYQNPLMVYNEDMRLKELLNRRLLNDLNKAIEEKQFTVYYQAKYDIQSDPPRLSSAEALIRWQHPQLGMISPADFIPLFEGNGLISIIDHYVWKQAASQVARWRDELGFNLPVSVNLSRADFLDPLLVEKMEDLVIENSLEHADMKLEVTESAYTDDGKQLLQIVRKLRDIGFEIEMDDFGSGYSSLNMLSDMPVDILKMDMKFVRNIENSETDLKLVKLILDLARYLQVHVVAEGVETKGQLSLLKNAGCDLVQGFYFAKPLPPEEFEKLIEEEIEKRRSIS